MTAPAIFDLKTPVTKATSGLVALDEKDPTSRTLHSLRQMRPGLSLWENAPLLWSVPGTGEAG